MDLLLLIARIVLAGVFVVAGISKLADRRGSIQAMRDFGVPATAAPPLGTLLPVAEVLVAALLVPTSTAKWGALGALVLLMAFIVGIGTNLARGKRPDCHCFGQLHSSPAGWPTLARNGVLAVLALGIVSLGWNDSGASAVAWLGDMSAIQGVTLGIGLVALGLLAAEGWVLYHLVSQNGRLLVRLDEIEAAALSGKPLAPALKSETSTSLPIGSPAPSFSLPGLHGETTTLDALRAGGAPVLLVMTDPGCGPCNALLPEIGAWQKEHAGKLTIATLTRGTPEANRAKSLEHGLANVLLQANREIATAYKSEVTPSAILVLADGTIGSTPAKGADGIRQLVTHTVGAKTASLNGHARNGQAPAPAPRPSPATIPVGDPAPAITLPDLDGHEVAVGSVAGLPTILLFWNPGCGYCQRMVDDLKLLEESSAGTTGILVVSRGDVERNREMGLRSTVLIDNDFAAGRAYGASGTPSGILIDAEGRVASALMVGAAGVLSLASPAQV